VANGEEIWNAFKELLELRDKRDQRRILRLHKETGFAASDVPDINLRERLDAALGEMMLRELEAQADPENGQKAKDVTDVPYFARLLRESPAFVQYLNYYLYFGVRFAAGRISDPCAQDDNRPAVQVQSDCNEPIIGLPSPPLCEDENFQLSLEDIRKFRTEIVPGDRSDRLVDAALDFLDDFTFQGRKGESEESANREPKDSESTKFELWLRGVYFFRRAEPELESHFRELESGLLRWARRRYEFYTHLETYRQNAQWLAMWERADWEAGRWNVSNPLIARCAIVDFYWLARLLRADVSARGRVVYSGRSWLYNLAMQQPASIEPPVDHPRQFLSPLDDQPIPSRKEILRWEEVLRSVFAYACDLIQNAVEIAEECEDRRTNPADYPPRPKANRPWREVYDEELREIEAQRKEWRPDDGPPRGSQRRDHCIESEATRGWSRRIWTGECVDNLVGIAFSGGGIRSATFNLGVLQRLQELDLLRHVDYLSTVSGGGYIGAWLVGNVRRTRYWLSRMTSWDKSIEFLREYSNYLAPHNGVLSADSWSMWSTWIRNAFLIQLTAFAWLASLLILMLLGKGVFDWVGEVTDNSKILVPAFLAFSIFLITAFLSFCLSALPARYPRAEREFPRMAAIIALTNAFMAAGLLWGEAERWGKWQVYPEVIGGITRQLPGILSYGYILRHAWSDWRPHLLYGSVVICWAMIVFGCLDLKGAARKLVAFIAITTATVFCAYLALCGLLRLYGQFIFSGGGVPAERSGWLAYVFGPPVAMAGIALTIVLFIGLLGRNARDSMREWWTRYGALIAMIGALALALSLAAVMSPLLIYKLTHVEWRKTVSIGAIAGWVGTTVSGLLAGKSQRTGKNGSQTSPVLEWVAWIGGLCFVIGAVILASTAVQFVLGEVFLPEFTADVSVYWQNLSALAFLKLLLVFVLVAVLALLFSWRFDLNIFGLNQFYRNRLVRCYLGATRWQPGKRKPNLFTGFDECDDITLASLRTSNMDFCGESFRGPFPIVNCALNLGGSSDLTVHTRQSASFILTPFVFGTLRKRVGYADILTLDKITLGQAISVSGAAASPNMGYNTSPLVALLLTMFNVRLGWWFANPGKPMHTATESLKVAYLVSELFGLADERRDFVNVSDGGHFENLGIYELIRRRARVIIAADAECDPELAFGSLGNVIRICETDFDASIDIDVSSIRLQDSGPSRVHCAVGKITYSNGALGYLIYIKSSVTGDEDVGVEQYRSAHPAFPHESTADQFFREDQFEAYRRLGHHVTERTFRDAGNAADPFLIAGKLFDLWVPATFSTEKFLAHARALDLMLERFRADLKLAPLLKEITGVELPLPPPPPTRPNAEERVACMELMQLMENVFLDLRLDDYWEHPDNRGWAVFFTMCARSPTFRDVWTQVRHTYGIRFEYFCNQHLGLEMDRPVIRV
jgi:Patatin-like phospholipase